MVDINKVLDEKIELILEKNGENKKIDKAFINFLGYFNFIIKNKKIIKRNSEVALILKYKFGIEFAEYVKKSRPLMIGRSNIFFIENKEELLMNELFNSLNQILNLALENKEYNVDWSDLIKRI